MHEGEELLSLFVKANAQQPPFHARTVVVEFGLDHRRRLHYTVEALDSRTVVPDMRGRKGRVAVLGFLGNSLAFDRHLKKVCGSLGRQRFVLAVLCEAEAAVGDDSKEL